MLSVFLWVIVIIVGIFVALGLIVVLLNLWFIQLKKDKYTDVDRWNFISWLTSWAVPLLTFLALLFPYSAPVDFSCSSFPLLCSGSCGLLFTSFGCSLHSVIVSTKRFNTCFQFP